MRVDRNNEILIEAVTNNLNWILSVYFHRTEIPNIKYLLSDL